MGVIRRQRHGISGKTRDRDQAGIVCSSLREDLVEETEHFRDVELYVFKIQ